MTALHYPQTFARPYPAQSYLPPLPICLFFFFNARSLPPFSLGEQHTRVHTLAGKRPRHSGHREGPVAGGREGRAAFPPSLFIETPDKSLPHRCHPSPVPPPSPFSPGALWDGASAQGGCAALARTARCDPFYPSRLIPDDSSRRGSGRERDASPLLPRRSRTAAAPHPRGTAEPPSTVASPRGHRGPTRPHLSVGMSKEQKAPSCQGAGWQSEAVQQHPSAGGGTDGAPPAGCGQLRCPGAAAGAGSSRSTPSTDPAPRPPLEAAAGALPGKGPARLGALSGWGSAAANKPRHAPG